ncbi:MAG: hypothetical protein P8N02_17900, partial [Actinomycetota bacterium]|nr:hypothetical protein [Actinomycetota bacterium]
TAAELTAAEEVSVAATAALLEFETELGVIDVGGAHGRAATEVLQLERQLAGADDDTVRAATSALLTQRSSQLAELEAALPEWRALAARETLAQEALVDAERRDELAASSGNRLATELVISSVITTSTAGTVDRFIPVLWTMAVVAVAVALLAWALYQRRIIIDETVAASRATAPEAPTAPGQFTAPDPRPVAAVVHRPATEPQPAPSQPASEVAATAPTPELVPSQARRARFTVLDRAAAR